VVIGSSIQPGGRLNYPAQWDKMKNLFIETSGFTERLPHYLDDDDYRELQMLSIAPERR
jgi:hypothetical protein